MKRLLATTVLFILCQAALAGTAAIDVPREAQAAVATVDGFFAALSSGNLDVVASVLEPNVVILESGGAEHSAAEYLGHHAKADAEFLKGAHQVLTRRTARVAGDIAWVATESDIEAQEGGKPVALASTETMVLRSTNAGWKIVHIHWSSRTKKPGTPP
jgi:ketosteroid isomerase-like protein